MKKTYFSLIIFLFISFLPLKQILDTDSAFAFSTSLKDSALPVKTGMASWYSKQSPGIRKHTANNEIFNDQDMTCAMWGVPFNTRVKVTNLQNGKSVDLRVNDRGPHKRFVKKGRIIDLTEAAFLKLDAPRKGLISVSVEFIL